MQLLLKTPHQVGQILRHRRTARGFSQQQIAVKLGISQGRLSALEADAAGLTVERLLAVANMMGLEIVIRDKPEAKVHSEW